MKIQDCKIKTWKIAMEVGEGANMMKDEMININQQMIMADGNGSEKRAVQDINRDSR